MTPDAREMLRKEAEDALANARMICNESLIDPSISRTIISLLDDLAEAEAKLAKAREALKHLAEPRNHGGLVIGQITKMERRAAEALKEIT